MRVLREQLRMVIQVARLDTLLDELMLDEKVTKVIESGLDGGFDHGAVSINDLVELFDEWVPKSELSRGSGGGGEGLLTRKSKPPTGDALGLSQHLWKFMTSMIASRLRQRFV